jgi:hypothetical protein
MEVRKPTGNRPPSRRQVAAATTKLKRAAERVRRIVDSFSYLPGYLHSPIDDGIDEDTDHSDQLRPDLSMVKSYLDVAIRSLTHLEDLRRRHKLRDFLKAYVTVHSCNFKGRWRDNEVSELINAALVGHGGDIYTTDAHKMWRNAHRGLLEEMRLIVARELLSLGYTVSYQERPGKVLSVVPVGVRPYSDEDLQEDRETEELSNRALKGSPRVRRNGRMKHGD